MGKRIRRSELEVVRHEAEEEGRQGSPCRSSRDTAARTGRSRRATRSLGYLDELEGLYDDPVAHFRAEVAAENEAARAEAAPITVTLHPLQRIDKRAEGRIDMGAAVPSAYFTANRSAISSSGAGRRGVLLRPVQDTRALTWNRVSVEGGRVRGQDRFPQACGFPRSTTCTAA